MADGPTSPVTRYLRQLSAEGHAGGLSDAVLLERFAAGRDGEAFAVLVRRHGPMVFAVCRRVLGDAHDAEDAFQATFLVLARKAGSVGRRDLLGNWLHGVALRTARKARHECARWQRIERELPEVADGNPPLDELSWHELRALLDEEVGRLPGRYRAPVVLCYLEGQTYAEAARQLGWPPGTVSGRLARARELLRLRLTRRGLALPAGLLGTLLTSHAAPTAIPAALLEATARAGTTLAAGMVSAKVITLTQGVLKAMLLTKVKTAAGVLLMLAVGGTLAGAITYQALGEERGIPGNQTAARAAEPASPDTPARRLKEGTPAAAAQARDPTKPPPPRPYPKDWKEEALFAERDLNILRRELLAPRDFESIQDPRFNLEGMLNALSEKYSAPNAPTPFYLAFEVNQKAFKREKLKEVLKTPIAEKKLPELRNESLSRYVQRILERIPVESGAAYIIRDGRIEITTNEAIRREFFPERTSHEFLPPLVHASFDKQPLDEALRKLSVRAGNYNIVINPNLEQAKAPVTATFHNVPVGTVVEVLAEMAGLSVVEKGRVLYVTSKQAEPRKK